jgi:hypothetical protein
MLALYFLSCFQLGVVDITDMKIQYSTYHQYIYFLKKRDIASINGIGK